MRTLSTLALIALSLGACRKEEAELPVDLDGDGYDATVDCDDHNVQVHPDAEELCNLVDDNCDGVVDTDATDAGEWYADVDGDGFGDEGSLTTACEVPSGHTDVGGDCDDTDPAFHPGALEADCADPADYNCDGSVGYADADGDGFAACEECDDGDSAVNPDAPETCNLVDDDCDRQVDEDALDATLWYADLDGDGFAGEAITERACQSPDGFMAEATDCDDTSASTFPGADERCDGADNDCDSAVDEEAVDMRAFYADADADHYGDAAHTLRACEVPEGYVTNDDDCDDGSTGSHPGATEVCDGLDNDCDQEVDESSAVDAATWYPDGDGDGFGDRTGALRACEAPEGYVSLPGDCDDGEAAAWPGNAEICDAVDNNCNGVVDDNAADAA
ncbi:MAG: putative metal-binding motif-containing protein, partial [Deltaproteobacteria bacterium]|nr:putative metal-binding motif-containing protein [Deltaproteobacteria bacterium]